MLGISMFFAVLFFIGTLAFFAFAYKNSGRERKQMIALGTVLLAGSAILTVSALTENVRLLVTGTIFPGGLFFVITSAFSLYSCMRCTSEVTAKCVGFQPTAKGAVTDCCPRFKYYYNEEIYEAASLSVYPMREAKRLYSIGAEYTVYIDPDYPRNCVCDVRRSWARHIFIIALNSVVALAGLAATLL